MEIVTSVKLHFSNSHSVLQLASDMGQSILKTWAPPHSHFLSISLSLSFSLSPAS